MINKISVLGIKMDLGFDNRGADKGPEAIRQAGLIRKLEYAGLVVENCGDLNLSMETEDYLNSNDHGTLDISLLTKEFSKLANSVKNIYDTGRIPLILGGDHSISIATIAGISPFYKNLGIIWFDAHGDLNTPETSPSGNIYGMSLGVNLGYGYTSFLEVGYSGPKVKTENIVLVGTRELDPGEREFLKKSGIKVLPTEEINRVGIEKVMGEALGYLKKTCDGVHLSFDMDALDPAYAPGVRTPCKKGVSLSDAVIAMEIIKQSRLLTSAEFVELNPNLDLKQQTARNLVEIAVALF